MNLPFINIHFQKSVPFSLQAKLTLVCEKKKPSDGLIYVLHKLVNDLRG